MTVRHVILDRDGVLNVEALGGGYVTDPDDWRWERGALEGLRRLAAAGLRLSVATNQSVVGRGGATQAQVDAVHARMAREAASVGARFAAVLVCPHGPDAGCVCRKPAPGLILEAVGLSGVPAGETLMVGDGPGDLAAGRAAGVSVALVRTGKGGTTAAGADVPTYDDLAALAAAVAGAR